MKRRIYIDDVGPYIKHEGYIWRPAKPLHIAHGPSCQCRTGVVPGESVECSATMGRFGPGLLTVAIAANKSVEFWAVRWDRDKRHEIKPGVFQCDIS